MASVLLTNVSSAAVNQGETRPPGGTEGGLTTAQQLVRSPQSAIPPNGASPPAGRPSKAPSAASTKDNPITPEAKAIAAVARQVNGPAFERALDDPRSGSTTAPDTWDVVQSVWASNSTLWAGVVNRFRLKSDVLLFRPLVFGEGYEDEDTTGCAVLNGGQKVVTSSSRSPFYCPADSTSGALYWPVKRTAAQWKSSGLPADVILRGLDIQMNQLLGEFIAVKIHETYRSMLGAEEIPPPMHPQVRAVGYCFAGAALQGLYFNRAAALGGLRWLSSTGQVQPEYERALAFGFDTNSLGKCMVEFWPNA